MILFDLQCDQHHQFEAWFPNNDSYEDQATSGLVTCPYCQSAAITKAPMAPHLNIHAEKKEVPSEVEKTSRSETPSTPHPLAPTTSEQDVNQTLQTMKEFVTKNFDNVGNDFAEEARKIHYGETKEHNIMGTTSADEAKELEEEGIDFFTLPVLPKKNS